VAAAIRRAMAVRARAEGVSLAAVKGTGSASMVTVVVATGRTAVRAAPVAAARNAKRSYKFKVQTSKLVGQFGSCEVVKQLCS
jgi:hypothetical protein